MIQYCIAGALDAALFDDLHEDVFDGPVESALLASYLADPRLHIVVALDDGHLIGMCSAMHYHHPDKPPQMWINELGVARPLRRRGIATALVSTLSDLARRLSCVEVWVIADPTAMAEGFYTSLGWTREGERLAMFTHDLSS